MDVIFLVIGVGCFGIWVGSLIERIINFAKVRSEMSKVIDRMAPGSK
jgi:hypothetical protein